ncbi:MAG: hypothetical protein ACOCP9_03870 [Halofilum sp. (in: g-proteobacteria)]
MATTRKAKRPTGGGETDAPLRGSREAMLGADGLRVSKASGTVPAKRPDDSRPSAYADDDSDKVADDEVHASREASLGGTATENHPAGALAPEDERLPYGARPGDPEPERDWAHDEGTGKKR